MLSRGSRMQSRTAAAGGVAAGANKARTHSTALAASAMGLRTVASRAVCRCKL